MRRIIILFAFVGALFLGAKTMAQTLGSARLAWNPSPGADVAGYDLYYGTSSGNYITAVPVGVGATNVTIYGLINGQTYYFAATSFDQEGNQSDFSPEISATIGSVIEAPPELLSAQAGILPGQFGFVTLDWLPIPGVAGYDIYYGISSGNYITAVPVAAGTTNVTIRGLINGQTYYFAATAFDGQDNQSSLSPEISATIDSVAQAPELLSATAGILPGPFGFVTLNWRPLSGVAGYYIYYGTSSGNYITAVPVAAGATSVTIRGLIKGQTYYFAASAFDSQGNQSGYSPEISATVDY